MKILFFGNQGNTGFRVGKWLRAKGYDVDLFIENEMKGRSRPEWEAPSLKGSYPDWIHPIKLRKRRFPFESKKAIIKYFPWFLSNSFKNFIGFSLPKDLSHKKVDCDFVLA